MFRRTLVGLVLVLAMTTSARAQLVVIDPANLYQTVLIAERTWQHYQELRRQYETILRMSRGLGQHGGLPDSDDRDHDARSQSLGVRPTVDSGPEQRGRDRRRLPVDGAAAAAADDDASAPDGRRPPNAGTPVRHDRNRRLGRDDGRPPGRPVARLSRSTPDRREGSRGRRPERAAALPRDDRHPRQDRGRRAARTPPGHGLEPAAVARAWSSCSPEASGSETPRPPPSTCSSPPGATARPRIKRSSRELATRFERGVSPEDFAQGGHHASCPARSCAVRRTLGPESPRRSASTTRGHGKEHGDRRREGVPAQHRAAAAQPAAANGTAPESVHHSREVRRRGSAALAHARRRLSVHAGVQRCPASLATLRAPPSSL